MSYYSNQDSMINICHTLQDLGWKIYGYKPDESDSMTDYFSPAYWEGIATKNGYTLAVDCLRWRVKQYSGKEIYEYHAPPVNYKYNAKIEQLQRLADDRAATDGEKAAAEEAIERLRQSMRNAEEEAEREKVLVERFPTFQENPPHCNWHMEKNGVIVAKGRGAFQFSGLPSWVDHMTGEERDGWHRRWDSSLNEDQLKDLAKFQSFIKKVEAVAAVKIGQGQDDEQYQSITITEYKRENKAVESTDGKIEVGQHFKLKANFRYDKHRGYVYEIACVYDNYFSAYKMNRKLNKLCTGSASSKNHFACSQDQFLKAIASGTITYCDIVEVSTPYEIEKCVNVKQDKQAAPPYDKEQADPPSSEVQPIALEIVQDTDTRDGAQIYVVKMLESLSREHYKQINEFIKANGGYYSKFKRGFIFRDGDPTDKLNPIMKAA